MIFWCTHEFVLCPTSYFLSEIGRLALQTRSFSSTRSPLDDLPRPPRTWKTLSNEKKLFKDFYSKLKAITLNFPCCWKESSERSLAASCAPSLLSCTRRTSRINSCQGYRISVRSLFLHRERARETWRRLQKTQERATENSWILFAENLSMRERGGGRVLFR